MLAMLTNSSQVSSRKPLFCLPLKFLSQIAGRAAISVISLSTSKLAKAANELIFVFFFVFAKLLVADSYSSLNLLIGLFFTLFFYTREDYFNSNAAKISLAASRSVGNYIILNRREKDFFLFRCSQTKHKNSFILFSLRCVYVLAC